MNYSLTIVIIVLLSFIYYINKINIVDSVKDTLQINIFNGISVIFLLIFIYYCLFFGLKRGLFSTIIIWCLFVVATPIPEAGLLVSVPLKNLLSIDLDTTQLVVSFLALGFIFYAYYNFRNTLKETKSGKILLKIVDFGSFSIFVTSIVASVSLSYLINELIDNIFYKKDIMNITNLIYLMTFIIPFVIYFYLFKKFIQ